MTIEYVAIFRDDLYGGLKYGQPSWKPWYRAYPSNCTLLGWIVRRAAPQGEG